MSQQTIQRPPAKPEREGFNGAGKPPVEPQRRSAFPNWGITALATLILVILLVAGVVFSQTLGTKPGTSTTPAPTTTSTPTSGTTPAPSPTTTHQPYDAHTSAAPQGTDVNVKLVIQETTITIAPGITYHAWTFNGTVPGPIIRVRQGQTVHATIVNNGSMPHSIDFHAASTAWSVNYQPIPAGKSFSFDWKAMYPGIFMYHCGTPPVIYHIANGMYGAFIVDPANGWSPAQEEYTLVQSEFYTHQGTDGTYTIDPTGLMNAIPNYVVFNGYENQYKAAPLTVKVGQKIRLFVLNAGPSQFSAFHVIGAMFDDVYVDGNPYNHMKGNQTVTVPPGGGAVIEMTIMNPGQYPFVTHSFADASKGALGVITVTP
jgi:nitrite reductase (NO-forming)